jgi:hypothetical protein
MLIGLGIGVTLALRYRFGGRGERPYAERGLNSPKVDKRSASAIFNTPDMFSKERSIAKRSA